MEIRSNMKLNGSTFYNAITSTKYLSKTQDGFWSYPIAIANDRSVILIWK